MQQALLLGKRPVLQGHWLSALYGRRAIPVELQLDNEGVDYTLKELVSRKRVLEFQQKHVALEWENIKNCMAWLKKEGCCPIMKEGSEDSGECEEREEDAAMKRKKRRKRKKQPEVAWKNPEKAAEEDEEAEDCLLYTSPSPRDATLSRMPSSA